MRLPEAAGPKQHSLTSVRRGFPVLNPMQSEPLTHIYEIRDERRDRLQRIEDGDRGRSLGRGSAWRCVPMRLARKAVCSKGFYSGRQESAGKVVISCLRNGQGEPMRAYYSTQEHFRVFILGTPEGWQVSVYDLERREWVEKSGKMEDTLKTAKATAHEKVSILLGRNAAEMKWH
jgi:hypothetical protein